MVLAYMMVLYSVPERVLVFVEAGTGEVGFIDPTPFKDTRRYTIGHSPRPVAVGYDPVEHVSLFPRS